MEAQTIINPEYLFAMQSKENQAWIKNYPLLLQRLGCYEGTILNFLLDQQWFIQNMKKRSRHKTHFRSAKEIGEMLGIPHRSVKLALKRLKSIGLVQTIRKGSPPVNNYFFDQEKILNVVNGPNLSWFQLGTIAQSSKQLRNM